MAQANIFSSVQVKEKAGWACQAKVYLPLLYQKNHNRRDLNSVLVYCLPLYGGLAVGDLKDLQVLQNKAAQVVTLSPPRASRSPMYDRLGWLSVNQLIFYHTVIAVFKIRSSKEPEQLASILVRDSRNSRIIIPNLDLSVAQRSFTLRGADSWNQLPLHITTAQKIGNFKKLARKWVTENIYIFLD